MGLEIISNVGAAYKDVPKDVMPKVDTTAHMDMMSSSVTQHVAQSETKAVNNSQEAQYYNEKNGKKEMPYQNGSQKIKKAIEKANKNAQKTHCEFAYHEDTNRISISIKDNETGDVIKEIPAEETLDMLSRMWELAGLFVDDKR
ncbi:MAG: flagellar protein FlaG [Lachnospiraceae bacterium]|nr:flagellar protein FlaG [Lachnospiraceae bacterium]